MGTQAYPVGPWDLPSGEGCVDLPGGEGATDLPLLFITITSLCNEVCGYVYSIQHLLYLIMINSFSLIIAPGFVWLFRRVN